MPVDSFALSWILPCSGGILRNLRLGVGLLTWLLSLLELLFHHAMLLDFCSYFRFNLTCGDLICYHLNFDMIRYSLSELISLRHCLPPASCVQRNLRVMHLLRRPKYCHRGLRHKFLTTASGINILSTRFQHPATRVDSHSIRPGNLRYPPITRTCSVRLQRDSINFAHFNVRSLNNKTAILQDIIVDR